MRATVLSESRIGRDDPVQLAQERQARRGLPFEQQHDERKCSPRVHPFVERLVVFGHLPFADARWADQQNEGGRFGDFLRKLRRPRSAGAQMRRREEYARSGVLALDRGFKPLRQRLIRRVIAEKPALHSSHRVRAVVREGLCLPLVARNETALLARGAWQDNDLPRISQLVRGPVLQPVAGRPRSFLVIRKIVIGSTAAMHTPLPQRVIHDRSGEAPGSSMSATS